jgi:hypothetical protein
MSAVAWAGERVPNRQVAAMAAGMGDAMYRMLRYLQTNRTKKSHLEGLAGLNRALLPLDRRDRPFVSMLSRLIVS